MIDTLSALVVDIFAAVRSGVLFRPFVVLCVFTRSTGAFRRAQKIVPKTFAVLSNAAIVLASTTLSFLFGLDFESVWPLFQSHLNCKLTVAALIILRVMTIWSGVLFADS